MENEQIPDVFASLLAVKPEDPREKYRLIFDGARPSEVTTIAQAKAFLPILARGIAEGHKIAPQPEVIAMEGLPAFRPDGLPSVAAAAFREFPLAQLEADGFPDSLPCRLYLKFDRGEGTAPHYMGLAQTIRDWFTNREWVWVNLGV